LKKAEKIAAKDALKNLAVPDSFEGMMMQSTQPSWNFIIKV
jgi:hypothetical protein